MNREWIYKDIYELRTPVGSFTVNSDLEKVKFSVSKSSFNIPWKVTDDKNCLIGEIEVNTNYDILINTDDIITDAEYRILFSNGKWDFCDSDDNTVCFDSVIDGWVIGIGAFDWNEEEKHIQALEYSKKSGFLASRIIQEPDHYDESKFEKYAINWLDEKNGFAFKKIDNTLDYLCFHVAWIKAENFQTIDYEAAIGFWLT